MICPRCSVAEISPETNRCVLCGYTAGPATAVAVEAGAPVAEPRLDQGARDELAQLFHLERALDSGGLVTTYVAREADTERKVVLRVLPRQPVRDANLEDRLLRELATAASLDHPHIVPLYRYGATPRYLWYSGKHVPGQSLAELLRASGPLELHPSLRLVEQVASALQYAHRRGVVHADVRPANVRVDPNGWSLLTGFAVGRALDRLPLTVLGGRPVRRPEYLAPEERYSRQPGPAADQYSLAVLVYECLTGSLPFDGMSPDDVEPPALTGPHPGLPEHVQEGLRRALRTRPGERFQSILEFVSVLESEPAPRASQQGQISRPSSARQLPAPPRALPAPPRVSPAPRRASPAPATAAPTAAGRPSANTPVLLVDQPGRWRAALRWIALAGLVAAGGVYGPELAQRLRGAPPTSATPAPGGPPRLVARDSGALERPPAAPSGTADSVAATPPSPVAPPRTTPPPLTTPRPTTAPRPAPLSAQAPARLFVNSTPWGQVYIDGQLVGNTPQANLVVAAGSHRVRVAREGFQPFERIVQLAPGQELRLTDIVLQETGP
jgi:serine/threonine-protein kinase